MATLMMRGSPPRPPQTAYPGLSQGATSRVQLVPLGGGKSERCASLGAAAREHRIERGGSLGPTPRSMFEKQDWSMPMDFSATASKLKEFPSLSKEPIDFRSVKTDPPLFSDKKPETVVPKPPQSSPSKGSSRPSSRLGSAALRSKENQGSKQKESGIPRPCEQDSGTENLRQVVQEPVIGDQTSAVIRQVLPLVQRALASSRPEVFDSSLKVLLRLAKVFGQESIVAHQGVLLDGVEKRLKETPASAQKNAPRVLQMLGDVGGAKTMQEIKRRFPELASGLSASTKG